MEHETAQQVNEHLGLAFDHLREAIMLALAGTPTGEVSTGAIGRLERFVASGGDTSVLMEGLPSDAQGFMEDVTGLFDPETFSEEVVAEVNPDHDNQGPLTPTEVVQAAEDLGMIIAKDPDTGLDTAFLPEPGPSDVFVDEPNKQEEFTQEEVEALAAEIAEEEEEDEFSGLFDDIEDEDSGPDDAPAAF